jgi:hypothetical protein
MNMPAFQFFTKTPLGFGNVMPVAVMAMAWTISKNEKGFRHAMPLPFIAARPD